MFTQESFYTIEKTYHEMLDASRFKMRRISLWVIFGVIVSGVLIYNILSMVNAFESSNEVLGLVGFVGFVLVFPIVAFVMSYSYKSSKIYYNYIYKEVIEHINQMEGTFYQYTGKKKYDKAHREIIKEGGLYPAASVSVDNQIFGYSSEQYPFNMYQLRDISSNGQSSTIHFDGIYIVLKQPVASMFQIRTNGRPHQKEVKYKKIDKIDKISIYKPEDEQMALTDQKYLDIVKKLMYDENIRSVDISSNLSELHLGIQYKKYPNKKIKELDLNAINSIVKYYMDIFRIIDSLES